MGPGRSKRGAENDMQDALLHDDCPEHFSFASKAVCPTQKPYKLLDPVSLEAVEPVTLRSLPHFSSGLEVPSVHIECFVFFLKKT